MTSLIYLLDYLFYSTFKSVISFSYFMKCSMKMKWNLYLTLSVSPVCGRPSSGAGCTPERETAVQQPGQRHRSVVLLS